MSPIVRTALLLPTFIVLSNSVKWASSDAKHTLPKSLFLAKVPDFFAGYRWPWVDSVGSAKFYTFARQGPLRCWQAVCAPMRVIQG